MLKDNTTNKDGQQDLKRSQCPYGQHDLKPTQCPYQQQCLSMRTSQPSDSRNDGILLSDEGE